PLTLTRALEQTYGAGARNVLAVRAANGTPTPASLDVRAAGNTDGFTLTANEPGTWGRAIRVTVVSDSSSGTQVWRLTLRYRAVSETFEGANVGAVRAAIAAGSTLVTVGDADNAGSGFDPVDTTLTGGSDAADVSPADLADALALLEDEPVNILLVAGAPASTIAPVVLGHLERTENEGRERIAILGATASGTPTAAPEILADTEAVSDDRVVLCAPGIRTTDPATDATVALPPPYLAAAVAGALSTVAPHISLTNKALPVVPDVRHSSSLAQTLLLNRVLLVRQKFGAQVVKAITTSPKPFDQISVRRTVDYAKAGVRLGCDPYIGRLNNARVRAALKATLDGFLSQMVLDEMLISYDLEVSATRAQEIAGVASVVMTLRPTFSIDYIRVTMNLE
ncbi:MAG TPA: phage tail sheath C-terminal domain-containing protein, partial [Egibacteraceae bacterium]